MNRAFRNGKEHLLRLVSAAFIGGDRLFEAQECTVTRLCEEAPTDERGYSKRSINRNSGQWLTWFNRNVKHHHPYKETANNCNHGNKPRQIARGLLPTRVALPRKRIAKRNGERICDSDDWCKHGDDEKVRANTKEDSVMLLKEHRKARPIN